MGHYQSSLSTIVMVDSGGIVVIWRRIGRALLGAVRRILAAIRTYLPRTLGGPDVLRAPGGGHTKVRPPKGFAPWYRGGRSPRPPLVHPRVQTVFRNAAIFLFDHCDLGVVPAQFWPFLFATGDPGEAVTLFIQAIGCDPERIRRGDHTEREKAAEIIDLLVMSGDIFDRLSPEAREALGRRLEAGDYATVRDAARIAAELRAALDIEARWRGSTLLPSFDNLLATIRKLAEHPLDAAPDDAAHAAQLARAYSAAQIDFDELCRRYDTIIAQLMHVWPSTGWSAGDEEGTLRSACAGFDTTSDGLRTVRDLNIDQVQFALDTMLAHAEVLERLLISARAASGTHASGSGSRSRGSTRRSEKERLLAEAFAYFGYSRSHLPTNDELRLKYRALHAELHRRNPPDKEDEQKRINIYRDAIRDFLNDLTRAAA
jgi:hypothetical protein